MRLPGRRRVVISRAEPRLPLPTGACRPATPAPSGREALASAVSTTLPFQARLSGGFAPSTAGPTRAAGDRAPELSPDTRIAIALLEKRATENADTGSPRRSWRRLPDSRRRRSRDRDDRGRGVATDGGRAVERSQRRLSGEGRADADHGKSSCSRARSKPRRSR